MNKRELWLAMENEGVAPVPGHAVVPVNNKLNITAEDPMQDAYEDMIHLNTGVDVGGMSESELSTYFGMSMEDLSNGKAMLEIEHVFYAKLMNPTQLEKADSKEHQEQWEIRVPKSDKNAGEGSLRVRKVQVTGGEPAYTMTTKVRMNDKNDKMEVSFPVTEDVFEQFRFLGAFGMRKDRYRFLIPGSDLVWEFDMFLKPGSDTDYQEWCKIDLEVPNRDQDIPPFPISLDEVIMPIGKRKDEEGEEAKVRELYDTMFLTPNPYRAKAAGKETGIPDVDKMGESKPTSSEAGTEEEGGDDPAKKPTPQEAQ